MSTTDPNKFLYLLPPGPDDKVTYKRTSIEWFKPNGIFCSVPIPVKEPITLSEAKENVLAWERDHQGKKICWLTVVDPEAKSNKEMRDYFAEIFPKYVIALAFINTSALGRMAANIFFGLKPATFPVKMFANAEEAEKWLVNYLPT